MAARVPVVQRKYSFSYHLKQEHIPRLRLASNNRYIGFPYSISNKERVLLTFTTISCLFYKVYKINKHL